MNFTNVPLALLPMAIDEMKALAAAPSPKANVLKKTPGRVARESLFGGLWPRVTYPMRQSIRRHASDSTVRAILLYINSPGGLVDGTIELAEEVRLAAQLKPVHVVCEGLLASAAYWIASQATSIAAAPSTLVGSIGVFEYRIDSSAEFQQLGLRAVLARTGAEKGVGLPGVEITEENFETMQNAVDLLMLKFQVAVGKGRNLSNANVEALSTGEAWLASTAKNMGLIDAIALPEDRFAEIEDEHREQHTGLTGMAAVDQLNRLAMHPLRSNCSFSDATQSEQDRLRREYPTLVAAAEAHQRKVRRHPWRYNERGELSPMFR